MSAVQTIWASHSNWLGSARPGPVRISILDSSFNPPTLAHLALATRQDPVTPFTAHCLSLSVKNVDKQAADSDGTRLRLEMIQLMAQSIVDKAEPGSGLANTAVLLLQEPTFVAKSTAIRNELSAAGHELNLTFVIGSQLALAQRTPPHTLTSIRSAQAGTLSFAASTPSIPPATRTCSAPSTTSSWTKAAGSPAPGAATFRLPRRRLF